MEDYNKIIESLGVRFIKSKNIKILQPLTVENFYDVGNTIWRVHAPRSLARSWQPSGTHRFRAGINDATKVERLRPRPSKPAL